MKKIKLCFVGSNPNFNGGLTVLNKNLIDYIQLSNKNIEISLIYRGAKNRNYNMNGVNYIEIKTPGIIFLEDILFNKKVSLFLKKKNFDIINSHGIWGYWMKFYKKRSDQKLIQTYHGVTYNFFKTHLKRFGIIKKIIFSPLLLFGYFLEKPPIKKADAIICVSERVKRELKILYNSKKNMEVLRTGVRLNEFKPRNKNPIREELKLEKNKIYGLYIGRGGFWRKGLDRAINLSQSIYEKEKNYKLMVIGADKSKVKHLINKKFVIFLENVPREKLKFYYNASDLFFCMSRYEGGAPILVVSEAMASGCLMVFSKDSEQEIIKDKNNGIIIENFDEKEVDKIIDVLKDKKIKEKIIKNSIKTIKEISLEIWGKRYLNILIN